MNAPVWPSRAWLWCLLVAAALAIPVACASVAPAEDTGGEGAAPGPGPVVSPVAPDAGVVPTGDDDAPAARVAAAPEQDGVDAGAPEAPPVVLTGDSFELPLPAGFREVSEGEEIAQNGLMQGTFDSGGLVLLQERAVDGADRRGVILARGPGPVFLKKVDGEACQGLAEQMAKRSQARITVAAQVSSLADQPACRFTLVDLDGIAIDNVFATVEGRSFSLQALHDEKEANTVAALDAALAGWTYRGERRASGRGFSIPLPDGFSLAEGTLAEKAGETGAAVVVANQRPPWPGSFLGSIWVQPLREGPGPWHRRDACQALGNELVQQLGGKAQTERVDVVTFPFGPTCRVQVADPATPIRRSITIPVYLGQRVFVVTCNLDVRDNMTREACQRVASDVIAFEG